MTEIYLIRHGEAEGNVFRRLHGQYNSLLMPRGFQQAERVKQRFANVPIDACYSSDLTRACLTSQSIYVPKNLPLHRDRRFRELEVGVWEDLAYGYLDRFEGENMVRFNKDPIHWSVHGSETFDDYTQRFLEGMTEAAQNHDGGTIAIFAHGAVLRGIMLRLFFMGKADSLPLSDNAGVSKLLYHKGEFTYEYLGDNSHIPGELSTFYIQSWWRKNDNRREANLYFLPYTSHMRLPSDLAVPDVDSRGEVMAAMLDDTPVGIVSMGAQDGFTGRVLGMTLLPSMSGRYYADQMLGCAVCHFRRLGCTDLELAPGQYPDQLAARYQFDPITYRRSFDANIAF